MPTLHWREGGTKSNATGPPQHGFEPVRRLNTLFGSSAEQLCLCFTAPCASHRWQTPAAVLEPEKSLE